MRVRACMWLEVSACVRVRVCVDLYCALRDSWGSSSAGRLLPVPSLGTDLSAGWWHLSSAVGGEILPNAEGRVGVLATSMCVCVHACACALPLLG